MTKKTAVLKKLELITILKRINNKDRPDVIKYLNKDGIDIVCETVHNILFNNINLNNRKKKKLKKLLINKRRDMESIADHKKSYNRRQSLLRQHGGNPLALILGTALPFLTNLLFRGK